MKVLWVCNMMLPRIAAHFNKEQSNKEGWLQGLSDTILDRGAQNDIELHIAFPAKEDLAGVCEKIPAGKSVLYAYGFAEDTVHLERYDKRLEQALSAILERVNPDVIHCFGTEYPHALALFRCCREPEKLLVGIQGVCQAIADAYLADLPPAVCKKNSFRDWLKKDGLLQQKQKFAERAEREREILQRVHHVAGRTAFDRAYALSCNPDVHYVVLNETLRACFYDGSWSREQAQPYRIFISQGDYPLKGFHYMLAAMGRLQERYPQVTLAVAGNSLVDYESLRDKVKISGYGAYLRKLIRRYQLEEKVSILGKLTAQQMKEQCLKSSVFVCCSANENSPNSLGEAMLLGVPCVAAKVGGIPSIFSEQDGMLYTADDAPQAAKSGEEDALLTPRMRQIADALADAVAMLWEDAERCDSLRGHAAVHAAATHDPDKNYETLVEIYRAIKETK